MILMASMTFLMLLVSSVIKSSETRKIDRLNLLLPVLPQELPNAKPIRQTIEAFSGCYTWYSSHPEILSVEGIPDITNPECNSKAVVTVITKTEHSGVVWITAVDRGSDIVT